MADSRSAKSRPIPSGELPAPNGTDLHCLNVAARPVPTVCGGMMDVPDEMDGVA